MPTILSTYNTLRDQIQTAKLQHDSVRAYMLTGKLHDVVAYIETQKPYLMDIVRYQMKGL